MVNCILVPYKNDIMFVHTNMISSGTIVVKPGRIEPASDQLAASEFCCAEISQLQFFRRKGVLAKQKTLAHFPMVLDIYQSHSIRISS